MEHPEHDLDYPPYRWPQSGWWFTLAGFLIGGLLLLSPKSIDLSLTYRLIIFATLSAVPALFIFFVTLARRLRKFWQREKRVPALVEKISDLNSELQNSYRLAGQLITERQNTRAFQIENCFCVNDEPCISIFLRNGIALEVGDELHVVDQELSLIHI